MGFYVYDHGYRIQTPAETLFPQRGVNALEKSRPAHRSADMEDRLHSDGEKFVIPGHSKPHEHHPAPATKAYIRTAEESSQEPLSSTLTLEHIMVAPVHCVAPSTPISLAWKRMQTLEIAHLVVTEDERPLGLLTKSDLQKAGVDQIAAVSTIYSKKLIAATPETRVQEAAINFIDYDISSIPVIDEDDKVIGIVCRTDLLRLLISGRHLERWA